MTDFFLDVWTFAFSQIGLVALGVLLAEWLGLTVKRKIDEIDPTDR